MSSQANVSRVARTATMPPPATTALATTDATPPANHGTSHAHRLPGSVSRARPSTPGMIARRGVEPSPTAEQGGQLLGVEGPVRVDQVNGAVVLARTAPLEGQAGALGRR